MPNSLSRLFPYIPDEGGSVRDHSAGHCGHWAVGANGGRHLEIISRDRLTKPGPGGAEP